MVGGRFIICSAMLYSCRVVTLHTHLVQLPALQVQCTRQRHPSAVKQAAKYHTLNALRSACSHMSDHNLNLLDHKNDLSQ